MARGGPKKKKKDIFDETLEAIGDLDVAPSPVGVSGDTVITSTVGLVAPVLSTQPEIDVVNFITAAPLGHTAEASHSVHRERYIAGKKVSYRFDDDPRFIRVESAGGSVDLIPLTNVASIHLK